MAEWIGGCRFKVEDVNNGWIIEFHPRKDGAIDAPKTKKHIAKHDSGHFLLLEVLKGLLVEQDQLDQDEQPTPSEPEV